MCRGAQYSQLFHTSARVTCDAEMIQSAVARVSHSELPWCVVQSPIAPIRLAVACVTSMEPISGVYNDAVLQCVLAQHVFGHVDHMSAAGWLPSHVTYCPLLVRNTAE
jgi:hypothetical protein